MAPSTPSLKPDRFRTFLADLLPRTYAVTQVPGLAALWHRLHAIYRSGTGPVRPRLHGRRLWLNAGNPYPFTVRAYPRFNTGLVETVRAIYAETGRPLRLIDAGAAVGDTAILIDERCPGAVSEHFCVDGSEEFSTYLRLNTADLPSVRFTRAMLAACDMQVAELVHNHPGTATAQGGGTVAATSLDAILGARVDGWDLLKTDLDGYDGEAISGAGRLLRASAPAVYFEWHPRLIREAKNDPVAFFSLLREAGYECYLWFGNRGPFSHFSTAPTPGELALAVGHLDREENLDDAHYDVLALPQKWAHLAGRIARRTGS